MAKMEHADVPATHADAALTHAEAGEKAKANSHTEESRCQVGMTLFALIDCLF